MSKVKSALKSISSYLSGHPTDEVVDKKEKMFQTYLIVIGLLLTYDRIPELQEVLVRLFLLFLLIGLIYYILLTHFHKVLRRSIFNFFALLMGFFFSLALFVFSGYMSVSYGETPVILNEFGFYLRAVLFGLLIAFSLFV